MFSRLYQKLVSENFLGGFNSKMPTYKKSLGLYCGPTLYQYCAWRVVQCRLMLLRSPRARLTLLRAEYFKRVNRFHTPMY